MDKQLVNNNEDNREAASRQQAQNGDKQAAAGQHTRVENAHASGLGAMGRNDEKLPGGEEGEASDTEEPVY